MNIRHLIVQIHRYSSSAWAGWRLDFLSRDNRTRVGRTLCCVDVTAAPPDGTLDHVPQVRQMGMFAGL